MSGGYPLPLLEPALTAAVAAMGKMEEREIPARIRAVASKQGQRLPPPLARSLMSELEESEWLRGKALEWLASGSDPATRLSTLYLSRPDGWEDEAASIAEQWESGRRGQADEGVQARLAKAERKVEELSLRLQKEQETHRKEVTRLEAERQQAVERAGEGAAATRRSNDALRSQLSATHMRIEELESAKAQTAALIAELKAGARPRRPDEPGGGPPSGWSLRGSPERLAAHLDEIARALAVLPVAAEPAPDQRVPTAVSIPVGIRPDRPEAIEWLRQQPARVRVVIDGWNVAYQMEEAPDADTQLRVVAAAQRLVAGSRGFGRITVLFDSEKAENRVKQQGAEIRYVPSADEEAIALARNSKTPVVVITSDRRVREAVESNGGVGLWSEALLGWLGGS
jgi:hypothetical protein